MDIILHFAPQYALSTSISVTPCTELCVCISLFTPVDWICYRKSNNVDNNIIIIQLLLLFRLNTAYLL